MPNLTILHNVYLTKEQRYKIHEGEDVEVIGSSLPVWTEDDKVKNDSEQEVFCKYYLTNPKKELPIEVMEDGYKITIPYRPQSKRKKISDEEWRELKENDPKALDEFYQNQVQEVSSKNLLDIKDGGSECLYFREHNKIKKENKIFNIMHFVQISDMTELENSLFMLEDNPSTKDQSSS